MQKNEGPVIKCVASLLFACWSVMWVACLFKFFEVSSLVNNVFEVYSKGITLFGLIFFSWLLFVLFGCWSRKSWCRTVLIFSSVIGFSDYYIMHFIRGAYSDQNSIAVIAGSLVGRIILLSFFLSPAFKKYMNKTGRTSSLASGVIGVSLLYLIVFSGIFMIKTISLKNTPMEVIDISQQVSSQFPDHWDETELNGWMIPIPAGATNRINDHVNGDPSYSFDKRDGTNIVSLTWVNPTQPMYSYLPEFSGIDSLEKDFNTRTSNQQTLWSCLFRINSRRDPCGFKKTEDFSLMASFWETDAKWFSQVCIDPNEGDYFEIILSAKEQLTLSAKIDLVSKIRKINLNQNIDPTR